MYRYESWTIKKAECWRIDAFELWCWRRLLRVPWAARRSNQSVLKEIIPRYSMGWLMLKLKLQYFCHLMGIASSLEKTLILGMVEGKRKGWQQRMRRLDSIITQWTCVWANFGWYWRIEEPGVLLIIGSQWLRHDLVTEKQWQIL